MSRAGTSGRAEAPDIPVSRTGEWVKETPWYVIHTRCHHEACVAERLAAKGLEIFLPTTTLPSRRRDRKAYVTLPLFPGYLFVHDCLEGDVYFYVVTMPGVARILGNNGQHTPVSPETIESLKLALASPRSCTPHPLVKRGQRVRITEGPLAGVIGIIVALKDKKRQVVVNVELFRRAMAVQLADEAVEPWYGC
jgi:transcription termination/antitermination protein NusG